MFAAFVAALGLGLAAGFWDLVLLALFAYSFAVLKLARAVELNGRPLSQVLSGPSVFEEGFSALPHDLAFLSFVAVVLPVTAVLVLVVVGGTVAWIGLATSCATSLAAALALGFEIKHRRGR